MFPHSSVVHTSVGKNCHSHYPYSCDGEGREADRQDNPGSHWAGSELTLSKAWGERVSSVPERRHNTGEGGVGGQVGAGRWLQGSLTHRETHKGGHERTKGGWHTNSVPQSPAISSNLNGE